MFYSHQILARKAPLGQIWMAATLHAKINRRKLNKLNIISICEEILNPAVPMALRLSGILMGGVVIVYERKVKLLYDDVTRLLVEINEAWKVKAAPDPTLLPKGKSRAKKEAVTLPENREADVGDVEHSASFSDANTIMGFQQTAYFTMQLDSVDDPYLDNDIREEDTFQNVHQDGVSADPNNIQFERFDPYQADAVPYDRFERFDIDEDGEMHQNFTAGDHTDIRTTTVTTSVHQESRRDKRNQNQQAVPPDERNENQQTENQVNQQSDVDACMEDRKDVLRNKGQQAQGPVKKRTRKQAAVVMDDEQTIIPGHIYQTWLQNTSDIVYRRGRKRKAGNNILSRLKVAKLMELPPLVLADKLFTTDGKIYYPAPLMELWNKSTHSLPVPPSQRPSSPAPPEYHQDPMEFAFDDFQSGVGSQSLDASIEKLRKEIRTEDLMEELRSNLVNNGVRMTEPNFMTPRDSDDDLRSIPSSGSGHNMPSNYSDPNSGRSNKKRPHSSSRHSGINLEPLAEGFTCNFPDPNFKLLRVPENNLTTPDQELLMETGPTQTQYPIISQPVDKLTDTLRTEMKAHFETPGAPQFESLENLTAGMNRAAAAKLFYQTCVLASRDFLRVEQLQPYGGILISKGAKM